MSPLSASATIVAAPPGRDYPEEIARAGERLAELRRSRAARVAELTRLSEALAASQQRQREADAEAATKAAAPTRAVRRAEVERSLVACSRRLEDVKARCVTLQATTPKPRDINDVPPDVKPLQERACALDQVLHACRMEVQELTARQHALQEGQVSERKAEQLLERQVSVLAEVYENADQVLTTVPSNEWGDMDAEQVVLALAHRALPLVSFNTSGEAVAHLRLMAKNLRPGLLPGGVVGAGVNRRAAVPGAAPNLA